MNTVQFQRKVLRALSQCAFLSEKLIGIPKSRYYCPTCSQNVFSWQPLVRDIGDGHSKLEKSPRICPHCKSLERTRLFSLYLAKYRILETQLDILHFAPEKGLESIFRAANIKGYLTTDLFMPNVDKVEDITKMSFPDNAFDLIYCSNVLEHIEDDKAAMSELYRILRPGGQAIIQVPIIGETTYEDPNIRSETERYKHFGQGDHVRVYGTDIEERLTSAGFDVSPFDILDELDLTEFEKDRMNIKRHELIHRCLKQSK
ncbi:methyltransferase domain-containing protein [Thalassobacterium sedimentorum]